MEIAIELDSIELNFITTAATTWGSNGLASYLKTAAIATSEIVIIQRMEQLRPLAASLPDAKASLETLTDALEAVYAIGLPELSLSLEAELDDVDEVIARLRDLLTDLQAFLRRHQS